MRFHLKQLAKRIRRNPLSLTWELPSFMLFIISGEFLLTWFANSGAVVLARSLWASFHTLVIAFWSNSVIDIGPRGTFDPLIALHQFQAHGVWYAYVFAAIYTALYSRFMAQWKYMGDLYNSLMAKTVDRGGIKAGGQQLAMWWAAFIEDAEMMHLATKESYAVPIRMLLLDSENGVMKEYQEGRDDGSAHLQHLAGRLGIVLPSLPAPPSQQEGPMQEPPSA